MNSGWQDDAPATEAQKEKLRFFGCTWDEGITVRQACDALADCAKQFPDAEAAYQKSLPATETQKDKLRFFGCTWNGDITEGHASDALAECAKQFPTRMAAYQARPATEPLLAELRSLHLEPVRTLTCGEAMDLIESIKARDVRWPVQASVSKPPAEVAPPIPAGCVETPLQYLHRTGRINDPVWLSWAWEAIMRQNKGPRITAEMETIAALLAARRKQLHLAESQPAPGQQVEARIAAEQLSQQGTKAGEHQRKGNFDGSHRGAVKQPNKGSRIIAEIAPVSTPPTPEQFAAIRSFGKEPPNGLTFEEAEIWIEQCKIFSPVKPQGQSSHEVTIHEAEKLRPPKQDLTYDEARRLSQKQWNEWIALLGSYGTEPRCELTLGQAREMSEQEWSEWRSLHGRLPAKAGDHSDGKASDWDWRNAPATEKQKERLRLRGCTYEEGITVGKAELLVEGYQHLRSAEPQPADQKLVVVPIPTLRPNPVAQSVNGEMIFKTWTDANHFVRPGHVLIFSYSWHWWLIAADAYRKFADVKTAEMVSPPPRAALLELQEFFTNLPAVALDTPFRRAALLELQEFFTGEAELHRAPSAAQEITIQKAPKPQNAHPTEFSIPPRPAQGIQPGSPVVRQPVSIPVQRIPPDPPAVPNPAAIRTTTPIERFAKWLDIVLERNPQIGLGTLRRGAWLNLQSFTQNTSIQIGLSRQIADTIESKGHCVEPDARFGGGTYARDQTLGLFKPFDGDPIQPSKAYIGAAKLLRLCVLIATADGRIDIVELDVFRQAIENQFSLTHTDQKRLIFLEQLLAQELCPASKTIPNIAKSVPRDKRPVIGKLLVEVAAANNFITMEERRVLERIFQEFEIPLNTLETLIDQFCPPQRREVLKTDVSERDKLLWSRWRTDHPGVVIDDFTLAKEAWNFNDWKALNERWKALHDRLHERHVQFVRTAPQKLVVQEAATGARQATTVRGEGFSPGNAKPQTIGKGPTSARTSKQPAPCPLCGWTKCCCANSEPTPARAAPTPSTRGPARHVPERAYDQGKVNLRPAFKLDRARVDAITNETKEVLGILSVWWEDEPDVSITLPKAVVVPGTEIPAIPSVCEAAPRTTRFSGLDAAFHPVLERLLTRDTWARPDFNALARDFHFMPLSIRDTINEWSDEALGDFVLTGEDPVVIRCELILKETS